MLKIIFVLLLLALSIAFQSFSKFCVLIIMFFFLKHGHCQEKLYNPFSIMSVTCLSYICYYAPIGGIYMNEISIDTEVLVILCLFALFLGMYVVSKRRISFINIGDRSVNFWFVFWVGALPTMIAIYLFGNTLDMSGEDMIEAKEKMSLPFLGQFAYWLPTSILVACKKNNSKYIVCALLASLYVALVSVTKTGMLMACLFFYIGVSKYNPDIMEFKIVKKLKKYALVWSPILIILYFSYNNDIRHTASSNRDMEYIESSGTTLVNNVNDTNQGLFLNYLYFCSPWSNLDYNVKYNHRRGYGKNTFGQFAHLLRLEDKRIIKINPFFLNTHTFITDFYIDFGYCGAVVASFLLGCLIFYFYKKYGLSNDPLLMGFYVLISYATFMMFFSNHFTNGYLLNYYISLVGFSYLTRKINLK